nr:MAG TPA: hypothetical protein [Caudoviricetes sp.]
MYLTVVISVYSAFCNRPLHYLLPQGLFIPCFLWFPISSDYLFISC